MPKLKDNQTQISIVMELEQYKKIESKAKELGLTISGYMKMCSLGAEVKIKI